MPMLSQLKINAFFVAMPLLYTKLVNLSRGVYGVK